MPPYHLAIVALALAASLLCVPAPLAAQAASDILAAFQGTGDQLSTDFLSRIFGCRLFPDGSNCDQQTPTAFAAVIGLFNLFSLALGMALFAWNASVGIMQTAHEGEVLGRRWSSLWAPVRTLTATAMLTPLPNMDGYNTIQVSIAWLVRGSTEAASVVWATVATLLIAHQAPVTSPGVLYNVEAIAGAWRGASCRAVISQTVGEIMGDESFVMRPHYVFLPGRDSSFVDLDTDIGGEVASPEPYFGSLASANGAAQAFAATHGGSRGSDLCGLVYLPEPPHVIRDSNLTNQWFDIHRERYRALQDTIDRVAHDLVGYEIAGQANNVGLTENVATAIISAGAAYHQGLENDLLNLISSVPVAAGHASEDARNRMSLIISGPYSEACTRRENLDRWMRPLCESDSNGQGWLGAGAWYMHMSRFANEVMAIVHVQPEAETVDIVAATTLIGKSADREATTFWERVWGGSKFSDSLVNRVTYMAKGMTGRWNAAAVVAAQRGAPVDSRLIHGVFGDEGGGTPRVSETVRHWISLKTQDWFLPAADADPMAGLAEFGHALLAWGIGLAAGGAVGGTAGAFVNLFPVAEIADTLGGIVVVLGGALVVAGAFLAFILPMLPFLLWIAAVTGYFLLVAEAVIAVNLWAIAHLRLDGEGLAGEAARQGYYLVLALTLTPILMVFGFLIGMAIFKVTATLVGIGADVAIRGLAHDQSWLVWLVGMAVIAILLVIVYVVMAERSFSLIAELPGRILCWIGADANVSSKEDDRIRATALGAARTIASTTSSTREAALGRSEGGLRTIANKSREKRGGR
ncbi:MAG: DotA/TraY family protein [Rhodobacteraceae bacterium]|nr:DotA/TraY family protein [Paracoccaceae bacterium]